MRLRRPQIGIQWAANSRPVPKECDMYHSVEEPSLSIAETAKRLGIQQYYLEEVCRCESPLKPMIASRIDEAYGGGAETWLAMQSAYDLWVMRELLAMFDGV